MSFYACKTCIWEEGLAGEKFREGWQWFHTPDEFLYHLKHFHGFSIKKRYACWPGMLEDAQALAEGYLICYRTLEPADGFEFVCYRCNATSYNAEDIRNLYCLACGRRYQDFYTTLRPLRSEVLS